MGSSYSQHAQRHRTKKAYDCLSRFAHRHCVPFVGRPFPHRCSVASLDCGNGTALQTMMTGQMTWAQVRAII
jgi:hypothetical protein